MIYKVSSSFVAVDLDFRYITFCSVSPHHTRNRLNVQKALATYISGLFFFGVMLSRFLFEVIFQSVFFHV